MPLITTIPYCDPADLGRFGVNRQAIEAVQVKDGQQPPINARARFMNGYLGKQFVLPLLAWGDDLRQCNACLAARDILDVRGRKPAENPEDSSIDRQCGEWLAWLKDVAAGMVTPEVTPSPSPGAAGVTPSAPLVMSNVSRGWQDAVGTSSGLPFAGRRR